MQNAYRSRQAVGNSRNSIRQAICTAVMHLAREAVRKEQTSFCYMGKSFNLTALTAREYCVTCDGRDAGIRVYDGIAELA